MVSRGYRSLGCQAIYGLDVQVNGSCVGFSRAHYPGTSNALNIVLLLIHQLGGAFPSDTHVITATVLSIELDTRNEKRNAKGHYAIISNFPLLTW
jgi:hypothetical protein